AHLANERRQGSLNDEWDGNLGKRQPVPRDRVAVPADGGIQAVAEVLASGPGRGMGSGRAGPTRELFLARGAPAAGVVADRVPIYLWGNRSNAGMPSGTWWNGCLSTV